jgi:hypothetical protein
MIRERTTQIVLIALCVIMMLITIFLASLAVMFSVSGGAVEFFGSNLYLVKNDSFELIPAPSVVKGEKVNPSALGVGDIVIFETETGYKSIGEIIEESSLVGDGENAENVENAENKEHFIISDNSGDAHIVPEHAVISKAVRTSRILGTIANFVTSPPGVLVIAVIPCMCIFLAEIFKPVFRKTQDKKKVPTINKQDETPTFIPKVLFETEEHDQSEEPKKSKKQKKSKKSDKPAKSAKIEKSAMALRAYKQALSLDSAFNDSDFAEAEESPQLFTTPVKTPDKSVPDIDMPLDEILQMQVMQGEKEKPKPTAPAPPKKDPLSSVKLAEVIAADIEGRELTAVEKTQRVNEIIESFGSDPK